VEAILVAAATIASTKLVDKFGHVAEANSETLLPSDVEHHVVTHVHEHHVHHTHDDTTPDSDQDDLSALI
jgi:hypothetical protein